MTIHDDYRVMVEFWHLYKRVDAIRREKGDDMWNETNLLCSNFGRHFGPLAQKLVLAMCDEFERRLNDD